MQNKKQKDKYSVIDELILEKQTQPKESWEKEIRYLMTDPDCDDKENAIKFIKNLLEEQKKNIIDDVLRKIDTDKNGRDITIYELGEFLIDKFIKRIKGL